MVGIEIDIPLFPHCDIHVALHGAPPLNLRVALRGFEAAPIPMPPQSSRSPRGEGRLRV
jgi:hypothetical protein